MYIGIVAYVIVTIGLMMVSPRVYSHITHHKIPDNTVLTLDLVMIIVGAAVFGRFIVSFF